MWWVPESNVLRDRVGVVLARANTNVSAGALRRVTRVRSCASIPARDHHGLGYHSERGFSHTNCRNAATSNTSLSTAQGYRCSSGAVQRRNRSSVTSYHEEKARQPTLNPCETNRVSSTRSTHPGDASSQPGPADTVLRRRRTVPSICTTTARSFSSVATSTAPVL
jgi:hypothetical protein